MFDINYKDILVITLNDKNEVQSIKCNLPVLGEGNNRIVYDLGDKVLKVAKTLDDSLINLWEINLFNEIKNRDCCIRFNTIFEYDDNQMWYVAEKIDMKYEAMEETLKLIPCIDCSDNAGYNQDGELTVVDADGLHWTWFVKEDNPYYTMVV